MKKAIFAIITTVILMLSVAFSTQFVMAVEPDEDYATILGVLSSDNFVLYPYQETSLDFGISKYGEMIDGGGVLPDVGLQYPGYEDVATHDQRLDTSRDPFANEQVDKNLWLNGWLLEARYTHRSYGDRRVLTMAMSADMNTYGGDWLTGHSFDMWAAPHGGRKTTGYAETEDLLVLYDGPRRYIAMATNHIYDWQDSDDDGVVDHPDETWPIIDVVLTFIFNKVKKQVIILKDIKIIISGKALDSAMDVQFGDREEWDLGPEPNWESYAHFYHQEFYTSYGNETDSQVHLATGIMREFLYERTLWVVNDTITLPINSGYYGGPIVLDSLRVYVNDVFQIEGTDYSADLDTGEIDWLPGHEPGDPDDPDLLEIYYKLWKYDDVYGEERSVLEGVPHLYDVAQIISADGKYVGWKAFWPTLSDYTVDGWTKSLEPLINVSVTDMIPSEPEIPFVIGEWDFMLGKGYPLQFRGVEVVGLTDYHDADDIQAASEDFDGDGSPANRLDREVQFQLDEVFIPWDLLDAVHKKDSRRWVEFFDYDDDFSETDSLLSTDDVPYITLDSTPLSATWDQYSTFAERVLVDGMLITPYRAILWDDSTTPMESTWLSYPYAYILSGPYIYFLEWDEDEEWWDPYDLTDGVTRVKVLYSTDASLMDTEYLQDYVYHLDNTDMDTQNDTMTTGSTGVWDYYDYGTDDLGVGHDFYADLGNFTITLLNATDDWSWAGDIWSWDGWELDDFKVFKGDTFWDWLDLDEDDLDTVPETYTAQPEFNVSDIILEQLEISVTADDLDTVHVYDLDISVRISLSLNYNATTDTLIAYTWVDVDQTFYESIGAQYEWIVVGRDAASVDSAGASLVAAAYKNKQFEIGIAGLDMMDPVIANQIPWVMANVSAGDTAADYKDEIGRAYLKDDWCTYWPVASSNMLTVGGPLANVFAYYANDFTDAFYGIPEYSGTTYSGMLTGIADWNRGWDGTWNVYESSEDTGYAIISTYKDINGTVIFDVFGHWGRDTYYATQWLHGDRARGIDPGIHQLQEAPAHLTSIIIEIDYEDIKHPEFSIVEALGTITEFYWEHGSEEKGGIHDP